MEYQIFLKGLDSRLSFKRLEYVTEPNLIVLPNLYEIFIMLTQELQAHVQVNVCVKIVALNDPDSYEKLPLFFKVPEFYFCFTYKCVE